jgi:DNA polymerase-1
MKLVALDALNVLHRAYHAIPALSTSSGIPINAVLGLVNILLKVLDEERPDYIACVFDFPAPSFRRQIFREYKANRLPAPPDLSSQIAIAREFMKAFGIPTFEVEGLEADDMLAALASKAKQEGVDSLLVSNDRDLLQVVSESVQVLSSGRRLEDTILYTPEEVERRLGVRPSQVPDLKALMGDPSDNISGVPGVGEKTAVRLLQSYGSLEALYHHLDEVEPAGLRESLEKQREAALQSRDLVRLRAEAEVNLALEECRTATINWPGAIEILGKYEFQKAIERIADQHKFNDLPLLSGKHRLIADSSEFDVVREMIFRAPLVSLAACCDSEEVSFAVYPCTSGMTSQLGEGEDEVLIITLPLVSALPLRGMDAQASLFGARPTRSEPQGLAIAVDELLESAKERLTVHDTKETARIFFSAAVSLPSPSFDTFLSSYLLDPGRQAFPLAELCRRLLGRALIPHPGEKRKGKKQEDRGTIEPYASLASYARCIALITPILKHQVEGKGLLSLLRELEIPLAFILAEMERCGVKLDVQALRQLSQHFQEELSALEEEICRLAGHPFNVASTKQLQQVLYSELGLKGTKRTKTGLSTDVEALERIADQHPIIPLILEHRTYAKLKSTYVDALPEAVNPATGRVHTTFNQAGTATGRLSSSEPNLQNIPIRTEWGNEVRRCFIAEEGDLLLSADYSQIELRILTHLSQEPVLLKVFSSGGDVHTETACAIFNMEEGQVTPEMRRQAKTVNFGIIYGIGARALAAALKIPEEQAQKMINEYFRSLPRVREYLERTKDEVRELGCAVTILGRRRFFPDISSPNHQVRAYAERAAINAPLQGSAADIIKLAMVKIRREVLPHFPGTRMILQVHDELLFELPAGQMRVFVREVQMAMETAFPLCIPLSVDVKVGNNWGEMGNVV